MTGENAIMYFAKNDMAMEKAMEVPKADLDGAPLFPAFASKNQILEVNFGQMVSLGMILCILLDSYLIQFNVLS